MTIFQNFSKIATILAAFAVCVKLVIGQANPDEVEFKKTEKMSTATQKQIDTESTAYKEAHEQIFEADEKRKADFEKEQKEQNFTIENNWKEIQKEMGISALIGLDQRDQILMDTKKKVCTAQQQRDKAVADKENAIKDVEEAIEAKKKAEEVLEAALIKLKETSDARNLADKDLAFLDEELKKAEKCEENVCTKLLIIHQAEILIKKKEQNYRQEEDRWEAIQPPTQRSIEIRKKLIQLVQKQLLIHEIQLLISSMSQGYYNNAVNATKLFILAISKEKILYLRSKYIANEPKLIERKCHSLKANCRKKIINFTRSESSKRLRNIKENPSNEMLLQMATYAVDTAYNQIEKRLTKEEKQKLDAMLMDKDENGHLTKANYLERIGKEVEEEIEGRFKELIKRKAITEYPTDQVQQQQQQQQQQQGQKLKQVMLVDQDEFAASSSSSAIKDITVVNENGYEQQKLGETTSAEYEITEIEQNQPDLASSENRSKGSGQLQRQKTSLQDLLSVSRSEDQEHSNNAAKTAGGSGNGVEQSNNVQQQRSAEADNNATVIGKEELITEDGNKELNKHWKSFSSVRSNRKSGELNG